MIDRMTNFTVSRNNSCLSTLSYVMLSTVSYASAVATAAIPVEVITHHLAILKKKLKLNYFSKFLISIIYKKDLIMYLILTN